jgi:hypothetical protein
MPKEVSAVRLNALRAMYLLIALGMGVQVWPLVLSHPGDVERMKGVVRSMLGALTLLALLGVRAPLKMLPLLLFELGWKAVWVLSFGLPLWWTGRLDPAHAQTLFECLLGVVLVPLVVPWGHVLSQLVAGPAERWRRGAPAHGLPGAPPA